MATVITGSSGNGTFYAVSGLEIFNSPPVNFMIAPETFIRRPWNPIRSASFEAPKVGNVFVPVAPVPPLLPTGFLRPAWNPNRSSEVPGRPLNPVFVPAAPVPPLLPDRFTRTAWSPERTVVFTPEVQVPGVVSLGLTVPVVRFNEPFTVTLTVVNGTPSSISIRDVIPYFDPENIPGAFGKVMVPGYASLPTGLSATLSVGLIRVLPGTSQLFTFGCVIFQAGTFTIGCEVYLYDGTLLLAPEVPVTVLPIGA